MTVRNCDNGGWEIIAETTPSGVTSVTHTGLDDYDWIVAMYQEVELSSAGYTVMQFGYGATPTLVNNFYVYGVSGANYQVHNGTDIYTRIQSTTSDGRGSVLIPNMARLEDDSGKVMRTPFTCGGYGTSSGYTSSGAGVIPSPLVPFTAVQYRATSGNLQGTGALCQTWGWRG